MANRYCCPRCGWIGTEKAMLADYVPDDGTSVEVYSNWICPSCEEWLSLEDYELVNPGNRSPG